MYNVVPIQYITDTVVSGLQDGLNCKEKDIRNCGTKASDEVLSPYPILLPSAAYKMSQRTAG
jgi:hypothetical protein